MIQIQKNPDKILISITSQLDREDVEQLVKDLNNWLYNNNAYEEAKAQNESKRELEISFEKHLEKEFGKEYVAKIKSTQHIQKELKVIELDPLNREVEITTTKLKENGK